MDQNDRAAARQAVAENGERLLRLLRRSDPGAAVDAEWRVVDVASHLAFVFRGFGEAAGGTSAQYARYVPEEQDFHKRLATVNAMLVKELADTTADQQMTVAVGMVEEGIAGFLDATAELDPDAELDTPWYGPGVTRTPDTLTALALGELLVHGLDVARAAGVPWPIARAEAALVGGEVFARMLPLMLTDVGRATTVAYRVRWRGAPPQKPDLVIRLEAGTVRTGPVRPGERVDCRVSADPVAFLLVGYGRMPTWRAIGTGRIASWGRRPWTALKLPELFCRP
ncbi:maleylpyruvate isomerase N-terminal domain-containing protein [Streptacidiphilus sp. EB129]|uniref:maleylpyruvate isomerase N-terminal domain-containing protein n=1 Tax=Streptacidiphilus sp. EB129 TaxID=3156262 RepID=UPI0035152158